MSYHVYNVVKFLAENRHVVGDHAPHIMLRAFHAGKVFGNGSIDAKDVNGIFQIDLWVSLFKRAVLSNLNHMQLWADGMRGMGPPISGVAILYILFGLEIPDELVELIDSKNPDSDEFNRVLRAKLAERGVEDWDVEIALHAVVPEPTESETVSNSQHN